MSARFTFVSRSQGTNDLRATRSTARRGAGTPGVTAAPTSTRLGSGHSQNRRSHANRENVSRQITQSVSRRLARRDWNYRMERTAQRCALKDIMVIRRRCSACSVRCHHRSTLVSSLLAQHPLRSQMQRSHLAWRVLSSRVATTARPSVRMAFMSLYRS